MKQPSRALCTWPVCAALLWAALVLSLHAVSTAAHINAVICPFRLATSLPCPTCGSTRAAFSLLTGHPARALALNPLAVLAAPLAAAALALRLRTGRWPIPGCTHRTPFWIALAALLLLNWLYLLAARPF